mmetsp:Transcript_19048/g.26813  ORF Transcript_19048/g.26813 Transcript_19048/m.26813 type:complete len:117 (-) Transcript_19048:1285-1635(-)
MRGHNVLFDEDNKRIGMAESTCDYKLLATGKGEEEFIDPYPDIDEITRSFRQNYLENVCDLNQYLCCALFFLKVVIPCCSGLLLLISLYSSGGQGSIDSCESSDDSEECYINSKER